MGKDRTHKGMWQTRMDQYTAQSSGAGLQKDPSSALEKGAEPTGAQILATIESSRHAMQTQIAAISVDANLLRADLRVVAERSVATEKQVTCLQSEMDTVKASMAIPEAKTHKLEARVEDAEGASTYLGAQALNRGIVLWGLHVGGGGGRPGDVVGPAIPLWRLRPDLLGDPENKKDFQDVLVGYFHTNWSTAGTRGLEREALKVVIRGESLKKTYGIWERLHRELTRQEEVLAAIQRQVDSGDALEADCLEVRGRIVDLWDRLENYVHRNYRQRLFREGDRSGHMLAWLLRQERSIPIIQMLRDSSGERIVGQLRVNAHLCEHLRVIYTSPWTVGETQIQEYLDDLRLPRLTAAQLFFIRSPIEFALLEL
ncbi:hypothetical protein NDU88_002543 [Pleurodeles waltl]|uniref:Uncharacterized protein n=1 Tax=Pleurodeles waltl TaxID=8319 RepID=A0AAV7Q7E8_PLEWA|nr:hypothetical protein NDU88_002543 [Pleurodeles waltl]